VYRLNGRRIRHRQEQDEEHAPARGRPEPVAAQECPDRGGRTSEAELCQFPLNPLIYPHRGFSRANLRITACVASSRAGRPGPAAGPAGPLPSDELAVPAKHGLGRHEERTPGLSRQVTAARAEEEAVAPTEPRPSDLPPEHVHLVGQDHDRQVLGIPAPLQKQSEESPQDQGRERPHHGGPPLQRCCPILWSLPLGTPTLNK
jgi:hypothetical protein